MVYNETPIIAFVKLFLLYGESAEDYKKIARFVIKTKPYLKVANINLVDDDTFYNLIKKTVEKKQDTKS